MFVYSLLLVQRFLFTRGVTFYLFAHTQVIYHVPLHIDYPSAFSVGYPFSTDNCNYFVSLGCLLATLFLRTTYFFSWQDQSDFTKLKQFSLKPWQILGRFYRISQSGIHRNSEIVFSVGIQETVIRFSYHFWLGGRQPFFCVFPSVRNADPLA